MTKGLGIRQRGADSESAPDKERLESVTEEKQMPGKILVTGATGNIGTVLVNHLVERGKPVKVGVRGISKAEEMGWEDIEMIHFDYEKPETFEPALKGVERIFILITVGGLHDRIIPIVNIAKQLDLRHVVYLSDMRIDLFRPNPRSINEDYIRNSGIPFTFLRPNWFMQTFSDPNPFMDGIRNKGAVYAPVGNGKASFIDTRDIGAVAAEVLSTDKHLNRCCTLTGNQALDFHEATRILSEISDRTIRYVPISDREFEAIWNKTYQTPVSANYLKACQLTRQDVFSEISPEVSDILGRDPITFRQYALDYAEFWS